MTTVILRKLRRVAAAARRTRGRGTDMGRKRTEERQQFLWDVMITALSGGVQYWARMEDVQSEQPDPNDAFTFRYTEATLYCQADGTFECGMSTKDNPIPKCLGHKITPEVIARGMGLATGKESTSDAIGWHYSRRRHVIEANRENYAGQLDAGDADNIVQLGAFGSVIYG